MDPMIAALRDPACYPHPVDRVEVLETHISWVLLAGAFAYKVKKPVRLPFLDFSTLAARRRFCEEELRLNRRTAPELYLDVVPIAPGTAGPVVGGAGEPLEYAVRMRRFADGALADAIAGRGELGPPQADAIAAALVRLHAAAPRAGPDAPYGAPELVEAQALGNFDQIAAASPRLARLRAWTAAESLRLAPVLAARLDGGWVRECHGDLHLANIAFVEGRALPFDCIEFDPALRWIDVASEVAFPVMDLLAHGLAPLAWRLLNAWLEALGDYGGVELLRFYLVYRAMVRAKIARLRGGEAAHDAAFEGYLALAESLAAPGRAALVLMHGVSGSGKSFVSQALLERMGAVRVRSDVERKRLAGLAATARAAAAPGEGLYGAEVTRRTYEYLEQTAGAVLRAGWPVIVDAACLARAQRDGLRRVAAAAGAPCLVAACEAPEALLRERIAARAAAGSDASDASLPVLERQLAAREPPGADEAALTIDTASSQAVRDAVEAIAARLAVGAEG